MTQYLVNNSLVDKHNVLLIYDKVFDGTFFFIK